MPSDSSPHRETDATALQMAMGPRHTFPYDRTVLDLFEERVRGDPDRPAVRYRDITWSYRQLDLAANAAARELIAKGVPPGSLVPLLITDGLAFPVGIFATLKAGAAFVPLDPAWPAERLRVIAAELKPHAILATEQTSEAAARMGLAPQTTTLRPEDESAQPPDARGRPKPSDLIYGFYTSGSSGTPKCALNRHRGLVNRLTAMSRRFGSGADQVTLQNSRSTFDSSMWQVLWPLISGGQVVLPDRDGILDLQQTAVTIGRYGVTITDFVPSVLAAFVSLLELRPDLRETASCLKRMLIGGESANPSVVLRLRTLLPKLLVTNTFGPTECSIGSVFHDITDADSERIPLGRPIDNTAAIVLDDQLRPVPVGVSGEVHLGGECVGAGYLNDAARTERTFIPNPFPQIEGDLLYRTGDLAKFDEGGRLHFLGRRDEQVKIGGVRVELGDVANALASHPLVGDALAVVLGEPPESILVGCVTPRSAGVEPSPTELRKHAALNLPAESVPPRIIVLDALPLNRNGKADRKRLTRLLSEQARSQRDTVAVEPAANAMEQLISEAWREVLGVDEVSVTTPFIEYGGTSLAAYRLTVAVSTRLGRPVPPRDLLVASTVRAQAAKLTHGHSDRLELTYLERDIAWRPPQALLLTGATGFVGAHLLAELFNHSDAKLVCLVRAADAREGGRRIIEALQRYRLASAWQSMAVALKAGRVEVVAGDLGKERFGLSAQRFATVGSSVTAVVHAGAMVNFIAGYLEHRNANVLGMQEIIRLASEGGARIHSLSTLSIFAPSDPAEPIAEGWLPDLEQAASDGYSLSKYVGERLLDNARGAGVNSVAYRLGEVWPHRELGVANDSSLAHNLLYACARTGCVFDTEATTDLTPADAVARFIVRSVTGQVHLPDGPMHLVWPGTLRFSDAFAALSRLCPLETVDYAEFRRRLDALAERANPDDRLARLRMLLPPAGTGPAAPEEFDRMFAASGNHFGTALFHQHADAALRPSGEPVAALDRYLKSLARMAQDRSQVGGGGVRLD